MNSQSPSFQFTELNLRGRRRGAVEPSPPPPMKKPKPENDFGDQQQQQQQSEPENVTVLLNLVQLYTNEVSFLKNQISYLQSKLRLAEENLSKTKSKLDLLPSSAADADLPHVIEFNADDIEKCNTFTNIKKPVVDLRRSNAGDAKRSLVIKSVAADTQKSNIFASTQKSSVEFDFSDAVAASADAEQLPVVEFRSPIVTARQSLDLIEDVRSYVKSNPHQFQPSNYVPSQHKRKLRSLVLCPTEDRLFITSGLDGTVKLWRFGYNEQGACDLLCSLNCESLNRRWAEDIAWDPNGDRLFLAFSADGGDSQVSVQNMNERGRRDYQILEDKPHVKGIVNSIACMPWNDYSCFATGGSDHAVVLWSEKDNSWKPEIVHWNQHSSAVMGIAGMQMKNTILSVGVDKRIIGFDLSESRAGFKHQIQYKCLSILPNPVDFNMFMVQSGQPGKQLRLLDVRTIHKEIHAFGWQQEHSESQSALINQAWSPDGWCVSSGSADPVIHVFDIRYNSTSPMQSVEAHRKRVFKAAWHKSLQMLTSISSDQTIGFHRIT